MQNDDELVSPGSDLSDQGETETEITEESEDIEYVGESYGTESTQSVDVSADYSGYFENLQTLDVLILGCLVAIGCIIAWIGAKRE